MVAQKFTWNTNPDWSPDGKQLVFTREVRGGPTGYYKVNVDGTGLTLIAEAFGADRPAWSPVPLGDGQYKIAFTDTNGDLFLINTDGKTGLTQLTDTPDISEMGVDWSPAADRLVVDSYDGTIGDFVIYRVDCGVVEGCSAMREGNVFQVPGSPLEGRNRLGFDWAKTQDKLVVSASTAFDGTYDLWIVDLGNPSQPTQLTDTPNVNEYNPTWSPDDSVIAFMSNVRYGPVSVRVIKSDAAYDTTGGTPIATQPASIVASVGVNWRRNP